MKEKLPEIYSYKGKLTSKKCVSLVEELMDYYGWVNEYMFRHSEYFFLNNVSIYYKQKRVHVEFDIEYRTNNHLVINHQHWRLHTDTIKDLLLLEKFIEHTELDIMKHTSDPDRTDQVFNKRFQKSLFDERNYKDKGWRIVKYMNTKYKE